MSLLTELTDLDRLRESVLRLVAKGARRGAEGDVLRMEPQQVAAALARSVRRGDHESRPARLHWAMLDKRRELYEFDLADAILQDAFAGLLTRRLEPSFSDRLHSYRAGRSARTAIESFLAYLRHHRRAVADPRQRGLYVVRADVKSYGESIPMHAGSPLWSDLRERLGAVSATEWRLVESLIRPTILRGDDGEASPLRGLPTGSPLGTAIANLYLMALDRRFEDPEIFYARFGDDLLIAHPARDRIDRGLAEMVELIEERGLRLSEAKVARLWFNGAGRAAADVAFRGVAAFTYLGCRIDFAGTIGLPRDKLRRTLHDVRARLQSVASSVAGLSLEAALRLFVGVVQEALDPRSAMATHYAAWLRDGVSDRRQLAELDHAIALSVAEAVSRRRGVRAFRHVSYRRLRREFGLPSLVAARNRGRSR